jgi:hypothetical protein
MFDRVTAFWLLQILAGIAYLARLLWVVARGWARPGTVPDFGVGRRLDRFGRKFQPLPAVDRDLVVRPTPGTEEPV